MIINQDPNSASSDTSWFSVDTKLSAERTRRQRLEDMDHARVFAQPPLHIPLYSHGCLQRAVVNAKQMLSTQSDDRCSFSIDSILARNCSRDTDPAKPSRMAINSGERFLSRRAAIHHARFHPYFSLPRVSLGQTNSLVKTSSKKDNEGKVTEQDGWPLDKPKRMRTIFTVEQLERMEMEFDRQQYMVGADRFFLANELGLTETQVKVWFQNRRIKWRKNILEKQHRQLKSEEQ